MITLFLLVSYASESIVLLFQVTGVYFEAVDAFKFNIRSHVIWSPDGAPDLVLIAC
jgi:hypothetical protein